MKRYIAIIMSALMILGCIFSMSSCWMLKKEDEQVSESEVEELEGELAKLESKDLGGTEFTILAREEFKYEALPDSDENDWISQKIYYRNSLVENKYNVKLDVRLVPGIWVNRTQYKTAIKTAVEMGGACDYDIISGAQNQISNYVTEGMFTNLYNSESINFDNPWWFKGFVDNMTLNNKIYFTVGDIGVTLLENMNVVVFNKTLFDQYKISYPYELVKEKKWTLERLVEISKGYACEDVNGNYMIESGDSFVLCGGGASLRSITTSFDIKITTPNEMGLLDITMYDERTVDIVDSFQNMLVSNGRAYFKDVNDDGSDVNPIEIFKDDRALMMFTLVGDISALSEMGSDFGIVIFPKYDDNQENYYTHVYETLTVYSIPMNAGSAEDSGLILEALGASSYDNVTEEYFKKVLSAQSAQDADSFEMLSMARQNISFNFGFVHSSTIGDIGAVFDNIKLGNYNITTRWEGSESSWNIALGRLLDKYLDMEDIDE